MTGNCVLPTISYTAKSEGTVPETAFISDTSCKCDTQPHSGTIIHWKDLKN